MKDYMQAGEYARYAKQTFRCVVDAHSQMKRCLLCDLRPYGLCDSVRCQPDERGDRQAVIFRLTRRCRQTAEQNESPITKNK